MDALDGLRGLAVMLVFLSHTSNGGYFLIPFLDMARTGKSGVMLFFVLSSFLLTHAFLIKSESAFSKDSLLNYLYRRFLRIFPLYVVYLTAGLVSTWLIRQWPGKIDIGIPFALSLQEYLAHILLQQGKGVTWSIMVEFRYYFILPVTAFIYIIAFKKKLFPSILFTVALVSMFLLAWPQSEVESNDSRLWPYIPVFLTGSVLALIHYSWQKCALSKIKYMPLVLETSGILGIIFLVLLIPSVASMLHYGERQFHMLHGQFIVHGVVWALVLFCCINGAGLMRNIFENNVLRYLGFVSFSIYLIHPMAISMVMRLPVEVGSTVRGWLMLMLTVGLAHISYKLIEVPTSRLRYPVKILQYQR
ncbi:acyltransferase family protein [Thiogranum longum]|nr:acyltransferase [Thiogranum longum]